MTTPQGQRWRPTLPLSIALRAVRAWVHETLSWRGVGGDRLTAQDFGRERLVADNATANGRQMNRRVEVLFADEAGDFPCK